MASAVGNTNRISTLHTADRPQWCGTRETTAASLFDFRLGAMPKPGEPGAGMFALGMAALRLAMTSARRQSVGQVEKRDSPPVEASNRSAGVAALHLPYPGSSRYS